MSEKLSADYQFINFSFCRFFKIHRFKVKVFISGRRGRFRTKSLKVTTYSEAVLIAISFEKEEKLSYHHLNSDSKVYGKRITI